MSTKDSDSAIVTYLKANPRKMGVLFTLVLLLTQATPAMAGNSGTVMGP